MNKYQKCNKILIQFIFKINNKWVLKWWKNKFKINIYKICKISAFITHNS